MPPILLFHAVVGASTLATVLVGLGMVRWLAGRPDAEVPHVSVANLIVAALGVAVFAVVKLMVLAAMGLSFFSLLRVIFVDAAVGLPLGGAIVVLARWMRLPLLGRVRAGRSVLLLALLMTLPAPLAAYAVFVEPHQVVLEEATKAVRGIPAGSPPIRVTVLADLQFRHLSDHEHEAVALALAQNPDLILLPGDVYSGPRSGYDEQREAITDLLGRLEAPGGVYLVEGDHDAPAVLADLSNATRVQWLRNEVVTTVVRGVRLAICGVELRYDSHAVQRLFRELADTPADIRLVMAHRPDVVYVIPDDVSVDLAVAGHTHGGQVQVPGIGPLVTLSSVPRSVAAGGLHEVAGRSLYVSRGIGMERGFAPPVRFMCVPEVSLLYLTSAE
jgi:predicted MPP superfamily phosphohydrolase